MVKGSSDPAQSIILNDMISYTEKKSLGMKLNISEEYQYNNDHSLSSASSSSYTMSSSSSSSFSCDSQQMNRNTLNDHRRNMIFMKLISNQTSEDKLNDVNMLISFFTNAVHDIKREILKESQKRDPNPNLIERNHQKDIIRGDLVNAAKEFLSERGKTIWFSREPAVFSNSVSFEKMVPYDSGYIHLFCAKNHFCQMKNGYHSHNNIHINIGALPEINADGIYQLCHSSNHPSGSKPIGNLCVTNQRTESLYETLHEKMQKYMIDYNDLDCLNFQHEKKSYSTWRLIKCVDLMIQLFTSFLMIKEYIFGKNRYNELNLESYYRQFMFWSDKDPIYMIAVDAIFVRALYKHKDVHHEYAYFRAMMIYDLLYPGWYLCNAFRIQASLFDKLFVGHVYKKGNDFILQEPEKENNSALIIFRMATDLEIRLKNYTGACKIKKQPIGKKYFNIKTIISLLGDSLSQHGPTFYRIFSTWNK